MVYATGLERNFRYVPKKFLWPHALFGGRGELTAQVMGRELGGWFGGAELLGQVPQPPLPLAMLEGENLKAVARGAAGANLSAVGGDAGGVGQLLIVGEGVTTGTGLGQRGREKPGAERQGEQARESCRVA